MNGKANPQAPGAAANAGPDYAARVPMIGAALAFACGAVAERFVFHPPWYWLGCGTLLALCALAAIRREQRLAYAATLCALGCVGGFSAQARETWNEDAQPGAKLSSYANGDEYVITGTVLRDGVLKPGAAPGQAPEQSIDLSVEQIVTNAGVVKVTGGLRLGIYAPGRRRTESDDSEESADAPAAMDLYTCGQRLELRAKLRPPENYKNPGAFDFVGYLREHGIEALGSAKTTNVSVLPGLGGSRTMQWRMAARRSVLAHIHRVWPEDKAALFAAMVIGDRAFLSRGTRAEYQRSGTFHILVVSGMNVAIFAAFLFWIVRRTRAGFELAAVLTILVTVGYALLTDMGPPVMRSVLMIAAYQATRVLYRRRNALNGVGVASLGLLVWDPRLVFDPSFQMTILAVFAIAGLGVPLLERLSGPYRRALGQLFVVGYDQAFEPKLAQWRIDMRMIAARLAVLLGRRVGNPLLTGTVGGALACFELVIVSALMQVAMALPMVWYFHRLPFRAFYANLAVVPLTGLLMPASVVAVALSYVSMWMAWLPARVALWALAGITGTVHMFGAAALHETRLAGPTLGARLFAAGGLAVAMLLVRRRRALCVIGFATMIAGAVWLSIPREHLARTPGVMEITAIDVGQGESLLVIAPDGKKLLLDSGGQLGFSRSEFDIGEEVTSPYLWNRGIQHLDAVAFSHGHSDHMGGMRAIVANFRPREIWLAENLPSPLFEELMKTCIEYNVGARLRVAGQDFEWGGARWKVLAPQAVKPNARVLDDSSLVLHVSNGGSSMLLPGDIHSKIERELLSAEIKSDLLKVPHHGSATSTSQEFVATVAPRFAVISAGVRNQFGHPRPVTLDTLEAAHVRTFRTDLMGPVTFYFDAQKVTPSVPR